MNNRAFLYLLYPARDFTRIRISLTQDDHIQEIEAKRFSHKRTFLYKDVLIELFLVQCKNDKHYTNFWGENIYYWPAHTLDHTDGYRIANKSALLSYRKHHEKLMNH